MTRPTIWACVGLAWVAACTPAEERFTEAEEPASRTPTDQTVPRSGMLVDVEWLAARVGNPDLVVLQVGSDETEYAAGHIPGARFLPVADIVQTTEGMSNELPSVERLDSVFEALGVSDRSHVVLYGAPLPAARTFFTLDFLGHGERTALLEGGVEEWEAGGYPLTSDAPSWAPGSFTPRPSTGMVVDASWVRARLDQPAFSLVDARPAEQFDGTDAGDGVVRPGHIPGAGNIFWEEMLRAPPSTTLLDDADLRSKFRAAGVEPGDTVIVYCRTGMQASFAYFIARYLGYETRMYDASFMDWSQRAEMPVER